MKIFVSVLALSLLAIPALAAEPASACAQLRSQALLSAPMRAGAIAASETVPTLQKVLDDKTKNLHEYWFKGPAGEKRKMWCDFSCTTGCDSLRMECMSSPGANCEYCCQLWMDCMCEGRCCTQNPCPTECPFCD